VEACGPYQLSDYVVPQDSAEHEENKTAEENEDRVSSAVFIFCRLTVSIKGDV
jgi:hypothetical protein